MRRLYTIVIVVCIGSLAFCNEGIFHYTREKTMIAKQLFTKCAIVKTYSIKKASVDVFSSGQKAIKDISCSFQTDSYPAPPRERTDTYGKNTAKARQKKLTVTNNQANHLQGLNI